MEFKEGDIVLCTVEKIIGTTVFVKIEDNGEGTIILSEVAAGRIRNIRDYVVPNKKIVCKILEIEPNGTIHLSLRRVTSKERKEVMERFEKERAYKNIIKIINPKNYIEIADKIKKEKNIVDFFDEAREKPEILKKFFKEEEANKLIKILKEKKEKQKEVKKEFKLECYDENGIIKIKNILKPFSKNIIYLAAGKYKISVKADSYKEAEKSIDEILAKIEKEAEKNKCEFEKITK